MLSLDKQNAYRQELRRRWPGWRPATKVYESTIRQYVQPGTRLLDAGCGRGGVLEQVSDLGAILTGIDPDTLSLTEHRLPTLALAAAFMNAIPFPADSFDLVVSSWVLEHLPHPAVAFAEVSRVLAPAGHFVTLAPNAWHPVTLLNRLLAWAGPIQARLVPWLYGRSEEDAFPVCYRANSAGRLQKLGKTAGLQVVALYTLSDPTYLAFNAPLFAFSRGMERWLPAAAGIHIVADFVRT